MKIIVCVDKKNGIMFCGKRVSQDSTLREKVMEIAYGSRLLMSEYSKKQFKEFDDVIVDNDCLDNAAEEDFCFVEYQTIPIDEVSEIYLFNWNRNYPADVFFEIEPKKYGFKRISKENFKGSSHDKITLEVYRRG